MKAKLGGAMGEAYTAEYFRRKKYDILAMNYKTRLGELDVIAANRKKLVFIEVKLRKSGSMISGAEAVGRAKQKRLRAAAELWMASHGEYTNRETSFTVAEIYLSQDGEVEEFNLIENAF